MQHALDHRVVDQPLRKILGDLAHMATRRPMVSKPRSASWHSSGDTPMPKLRRTSFIFFAMKIYDESGEQLTETWSQPGRDGARWMSVARIGSFFPQPSLDSCRPQNVLISFSSEAQVNGTEPQREHAPAYGRAGARR